MRVIMPREMADIDRTAIEVEGVDGLDLMERAGAGVANVARDMLSSKGGRRVALWCGKGNNGGDGFVAARLLAGAGFDAEVFAFAVSGELSGDGRVNFERLAGLPVRITPVRGSADIAAFSGASPRFDLVVDAVFGTGFSGKVSGVFADAIEAMNTYGCPVLAVDVPSGVSGETGAVAGAAVSASRTVTFAVLKTGLVLYPGAGLAGELEVVDIGIPPRLLDTVPASRIEFIEQVDADALLPVRPADAHKRQCGSVLVVGGSPGMTGAPALCAQAALRSGAGLVTAGVPASLSCILEVKLTEVMTYHLPEEDGSFSSAASRSILERASDFDVVALGPGMGTSPGAIDLARTLVGSLAVPIVLDADGLNAMAGATGLLAGRTGPVVMTPHPGEMARLAGMSTGEIQADRLGAACEGARAWGAVVVLKGARTVIAEPGGRVAINSSGNPGMATAGMGDVLTGCIASFLGQGLDAFEASVAGAYFHGSAADLAAGMDGMIGLTAGDVVRHMPLALRAAL